MPMHFGSEYVNHLYVGDRRIDSAYLWDGSKWNVVHKYLRSASWGEQSSVLVADSDASSGGWLLTKLASFTVSGNGSGVFAVAHSWNSTPIHISWAERRLYIRVYDSRGNYKYDAGYESQDHRAIGWDAVMTRTLEGLRDGDEIRISGAATSPNTNIRTARILEASLVPHPAPD
ncbi:hypothetical protein [Rhodococcus xishaensis]|uniref:Uncharacterized protein n=1 Tax=Rhodococcus xishaensis TaxID=2487364 RepID=A0A438AWB8_9NOCA|nr:hypothetical protein [Rhodococcus xishaensis]RVW02996.1 hypothetical protein EGT50_09805 [Rhodococcus xishaensis]